MASGVVALSLMVAVGCGESPSDTQTPEQTQELMQRIFREISMVLPLAVDDGRLADPARRAEIEGALATLSQNGELLQEHVSGGDAQLRFLARSVAGDAHGVERAYLEGRYERAGFLLRRITENCVVCHTRLPSRDDSQVALGFVEQSAFDSLELEPRATLQIATRRFDAALVTLEELLDSPESPVLMMGPLTDYLVVAIRVKGDYDRPIPTLRRFAARPDTWPQLRADIETWADALPGLEARATAAPDLATARAMLAEGHAMVDSAADRAWLAHFIVASSILQRVIDADPEPGPELAEAYYLLGITEARIGRNYWVTPAPFLLETAIRMAPLEGFSQESFALLEQEILMSYEGSDYEEIPPEERAALDELEALMDAR